MNKLYTNIRTSVVLLALLVLGTNAFAQSPACSTYIFSTSNEPFTYISGATSASGIHCDDCALGGVSLGFSFPFCGNYYNTVAVHSNGYISLVNSTSVYLSADASYLSTLGPTLFPMWGDEWGTSGANASYVTTGSSPNRIFTFEWKNWRPFSYSANPEYSMQVRLYETTGRIQFAYKRETGTSPLPCVAVGIGYSPTDYQSLPNFTASPTPSSTTFTTCISSYFTNNQVYTWDAPTPCAKSTALTITAFNSTTASFTWTGVTGAASYDYAVDQNANFAPAGTTTIYNTPFTYGNITGMTPSSTYFLHVRTRCSPTSISLWDTVTIRTLPPCSKPNGFIASNIDSNSANIQWTPAGNVLQYKYLVDRNMATPSSSNPNLKITTTTFVPLPDTLQDGTLYYVHIRAMCVANDSSIWSLDSFRTPVPCRKAQLSVTYLSANNSVTSWPLVPTAYNYEYYLGPVSTLPPNGTPILVNTVMTPYVLPNTSYTMSVRCNCEFYGVKTTSDWNSIDFTTPHPNSVANTNAPRVSLEAYPNPVKNTLTIRAVGVLSKNSTASLLDINSKLIKVINIENETTQLDVSGLSSGVYMIKYTDESQSSALKFTKE